MRSVYNFVVKPKGERYNNTKKLDGGELILNTEIFNHQYVNREAEVISTPIIGDTDIKPGDTVVVHHNVFRRWHNVKGVEKNHQTRCKDNDLMHKSLYNGWKLLPKRIQSKTEALCTTRISSSSYENN